MSYATYTASSEASGLGANRLKDPQIRKRWRTGPGVTTPTLLVDFNKSVSVGVLAFVQPSDAGYYDPDLNAVGILASSDTVRHRLDITTPGVGAVYDSGTVAGQWTPGYGLHAKILPANVLTRYWRTSFNAASQVGVTNYMDMGMAWAGPAWSPQRNLQYGFNWVWQDTSTLTSVGTSGLDFVKIGPKRKAVVFGFDSMSASEADEITQLSRLVGTSRQILFVPDPSDMTSEKNQPIIGRLVDTNPIAVPSFGTYTKTFTLLQSL